MAGVKKIVWDAKRAAPKKAWSPKVLARIDGMYVLRIGKMEGEFKWHQHAKEDELFLVIDGEMIMQTKGGNHRVKAGEGVLVKKGTMHCPKSGGKNPAIILLIENSRTKRTGD